jgi:cytochrome c553
MSADTRKANTNQMILFAKSMTDDEMKDAARYFSSMKWTPWIRVVEANMVPKNADCERHIPSSRRG